MRLSQFTVDPRAAAAHPPTRNQLLAALPTAELHRLEPALELVEMPLGRTVYEPGEPVYCVVFPTAGIVSLRYLLADGASTEFSLTGNEGVVGIAAFMGGNSSPSRAVVQSAGHAYRLKTQVLIREIERGGELQGLLLRYTQALISQISQNAVCNRHHTLEQRLCRWLLLSLNRLSANRLHMTQELIAHMLGVRRESVTEAVGRLRDAGLIQNQRARITVLDRPGLERRVCECYAVVEKEADRLFSSKPGLRAPQAARWPAASTSQ